MSSCPECTQLKSSTFLPAGLLQPLPVPTWPWSHLAMNFITNLPFSHENTVILTIVDQLSKMCCLLPLSKLPTASELVDLLRTWVFRLCGIPEDIVSDRGPQFTSQVFKAYSVKLNFSLSLPSSYHPQSNGIAKRTNQEPSNILRFICKNRPTEWAIHLLSHSVLGRHIYPSSLRGQSKLEVQAIESTRWKFSNETISYMIESILLAFPIL